MLLKGIQIMDRDLSKWGKIAGILAVAAIGVVVVMSMAERKEEAAWAIWADDLVTADEIESLENARDRAESTSAEPWISYRLAIRLQDEGGDANFDRARQIAAQYLERFPDHVVAPLFEDLIRVLDTYDSAPVKPAPITP